MKIGMTYIKQHLYRGYIYFVTTDIINYILYMEKGFLIDIPLIVRMKLRECKLDKQDDAQNSSVCKI